MLLFVSIDAIESKLVKLETTIGTVILFPTVSVQWLNH